uniref:Thymidylate kinase n=1 Tax=candidate division WWE3 bacterium TaxID=2053526 RepID=A0A831YZS1_UNCKA
MGRLGDHLFDELLTLVRVNPSPGKLINIDALDGAGNSTQTELLADYLRNQRGISTILTREPTDGEYGKAIRRILRKERTLSPIPFQQLFCVDRGDHLDQLILPALERGDWVVTSRYALSTLAFGIANDIPAWLLLGMNVYYPWPDLNIVLMVPVEECLRRMKDRPLKELFEKKETLERTLAAYQKLSEKLPKVVFVDGTGSEEAVFARVRNLVRKRLMP